MNTLPIYPHKYLLTGYSHAPGCWFIVENGHITHKATSFADVMTVWKDKPPATVYDAEDRMFVPLVLGA